MRTQTSPLFIIPHPALIIPPSPHLHELPSQTQIAKRMMAATMTTMHGHPAIAQPTTNRCQFCCQQNVNPQMSMENAEPFATMPI